MAASSPPPADPPRLTDDDAEHLRAMARALLRADGFALLFARANLPARRRELADALKHELAGQMEVLEVTLAEPITDLQALLARRLEEEPAGGRRALFVYGFEQSLPSDPLSDERTSERRYPALAVLNLKRETLKETVRAPVVLWLPEYALRAIARGAPDLWAWRSGVFDFSMPTEEVERMWSTMRDSGSEDEFDRLTPAERRERAQTLEALLEQYDARPDADTPEILRIRFDLADRLARLYRRLADYDASLQYARKALDLAEHLDEPTISLAANNLGSVLHELGDLEEARAAFERALRIDEATLGRDHPNVATRINNLGLVLQDLGDREGARAALERALSISEHVLGAEHPHTQLVRKNLASLDR